MAKQQQKLFLVSAILLAIFIIIFFINHHFFTINKVVTNDSLNKTKLSTPDTINSSNSATHEHQTPATNKQTVENFNVQNLSPSFKQHPDWRITGKLKDKFDDLIQRFDNGDLIAGYVLSMNLKYCWNSPSSEVLYNHKLQLALDNNESSQYIAHLTEKYNKCQGISDAQRQQFYHYLNASAEQGLVIAQEQFSQINAEFYMNSQYNAELSRADYVATRDSFIDKKLFFLTQAANQGSLKAMATLSNMYHSQNYGAKGWIKAYAYNQAILNFTDNNELYRRYQWYIEKSSQQLSPEELILAEEIASKLIKSVNNNGTLYRVK